MSRNLDNPILADLTRPATVPSSLRVGLGKVFLTALLLTFITLLTGCQEAEQPTLAQFKEQWYAAVNQRKPEELFHMLDAKSQGIISQQLNQLRGLDQEKQKQFINELGGDRVSSLHDMDYARYFGLLWRRITDGEVPTMKIEAEGDNSAYMVLGLKNKSTRIQLRLEGGKWTWALPKQEFKSPPIKH